MTLSDVVEEMPMEMEPQEECVEEDEKDGVGSVVLVEQSGEYPRGKGREEQVMHEVQAVVRRLACDDHQASKSCSQVQKFNFEGVTMLRLGEFCAAHDSRIGVGVRLCDDA